MALFFYRKFYNLPQEFREYLEGTEMVSGNTLVKKVYSINPNSQIVQKLSQMYDLEIITSEYWGKNFSHYQFYKLDFQENPYHYVVKIVQKDKIIAFIVDPTDFLEINEIREKYGEEISWFLTTKQGLEEIKGYIAKNLDLKAREGVHDTTHSNQEEVVLEDEIVKFVNKVIEEAVRRKASDIHFEVYEKEMIIKYRLDGVLYSYQKVEKSQQNKIVSRIKIMAGLNISQTRVPQDGRFSMTIDGEEINFRVSILPSIFGETVVIRILSSYQFDYSFEYLGMDESEKGIFKHALSMAGMILVAGPTGSGKTTTLYAAIREIKGKGYKIITIEDPVEYDIPGIVQIAVNEKVGLTFSSGLRSIVRQDPDVIMVGEIRDSETANIAINAALTGHLVLSTIHSNSPFDTLLRLNHLQVSTYQLVSAISLIVFQRLVRKNCQDCLQEVVPDQFYIKKYQRFFGTNPPEKIYKSRGCDKCYFTGYEGRVGLFEMVDFSNLRTELLKKEDYGEWKEILEKNRVISIKERARQLVNKGLTSLEEIERSLI